MGKKPVNEKQIWILTPFEQPDAGLVSAAARAGAFPVLHLGRDRALAEAALRRASSVEVFGVCLAGEPAWDIRLPSQVSRIVLPWGVKPPKAENAEIIWQVTTARDAEEALAAHAKTLILKGCEGAGLSGDDSSFILFQKVISACRQAGTAVLVQGGVGVHTASAYIALGAEGVILDSQVALFPECGLSQEVKTALGRLSGNEIRECQGYRYYVPFGSNERGDFTNLDELNARLSAEGSSILPLGQDIILATDLADEYKRLKNLTRALKRATLAHVKQARITDAFAPGGEMAQAMGTPYPLAQGPMARISDVPGFLRDVSEGGALPFLAMSMMTGEAAEGALARTAAVMGDKPWGVGILGFIYPRTIKEQTRLILEHKPTHVLIAGGRPGQQAVFEQAGINVLLHAPTPSVLELFLKEGAGASAFIFEGRESGGHVGPLFSTVLWEKQINKILKMENPSELRVFFAGGIHDAFSAAFTRVMAGPLAARGVKIGLLCGTAYLYTEEAVSRGAISQNYQRRLLEQNRTQLLKSGGGQEVRCVPSPFADFFLAEKARMEKEGLPSGEISLKLETLNLGRLRVASKGITRRDGKMIPMSESEQWEQGLYMTGAVTEFTNNTTTINGLHERLIHDSLHTLSEIDLPEPETAPAALSDVAIIGMAGIFPEAENLDEFWRNILFGHDCITEVPRERWSVDTYFDPDAKDTDHVVSKWGGFLGKTDFDALEFGITPQSIASVEPVQLLSLLMAKRALEDAGFTDLSQVDLEDTSVIFGTGGGGELTKDYMARMMLMELMGEMPKEVDETLPRLTEDSFPGVLSNVVSGRVSNRLNTGGRNFTVEAACASSLAALDIAFTELRMKKADMVILGGADLHNGISDYLLFGCTHALSPKGRCSTFDAGADGVVISEGIAAVILKRLEDAERDGNKIYAVIKGVGGSSDGKNLGLTAPSKRGQVLALERAYESAAIRPSDVGLIESHGTGTAVGDRTELQALSHVFWEDGARPGQTALGSLKSLIGHTKNAAGIGGLIKAVFCVRYGILPPTLHLRKPNKVYAPGSPFCFRTEKAGYWRDERRVAGVSGFGFGGANFHAVIQNYDSDRPDTTLKSWPSELFVFPGDSMEQAAGLMDKIAEMLAVNDKLRLIDIAYSLAIRCDGSAIQYALVAGSRDQLLERMRLAREGVEDENIYRLKPVSGKVAFLFPGQGSQRIHMAADLFIMFPRMRRLLQGRPDFERILFPPSVFTESEKKTQREEITDTRNAQPLLGIVDLAIAELLKDFGIEPDMVAGHSYGELPALCFAGALAESELISLSRARAEAILKAAGDDKGRMAAVFTDRETLTGLLEGLEDVWPVNFNAPRQTVVAGADVGMDAFLRKAEAAGVSCNELNVACAFHSPLLRGADEMFAAALKEVTFCEPALPVLSNTDAGPYPMTDVEIKDRLSRHLVHPVYFADEIENMSRDGAAVFVEAGPGGSLTKLVTQILKDKEIAAIQIERGGENGLTLLLQGFAKYIASGRMIKMDEIFNGRDAAKLEIDNPQMNQKEGLVWNIDGRAAVSENTEVSTGLLSSHEAISARLKSAWLQSGQSGIQVEQIMMSYLDNMNAMIQDQRDVMLGYLGAPEIAPRSEGARRRFAMLDMPVAEAQIAVETGPDSQNGDGAQLLDLQSMTTDQITELIFEIVSEKTGYPTSMLNLDTDLEADLSIDSIKKMEIVGGLRGRVQMPDSEDEEGMEAYLEKIISVRTFRDLTAWIEELGQASATVASTGGATQETVIARSVVDFTDNSPAAARADITRMVCVETAYPLSEKDESLISGKSFVLPDDGAGLAAAVAKRLTELGAWARVIRVEDSPELSKSPNLSDCDGLILINAMAGTRRYSVLDLFQLLKGANMDKLEWALVFDDTLGASIESGELPEGFSGFLKSLAHEYPDKRFCAAQFMTPFDPAGFAGAVADELTAVKPPLAELYYRDRERFLMVPQISDIRTETIALQTVLDKDSVVVVLGGAQGISPHVVARLAQDFPCRYILVGRSAQSPEAEAKAFASCETIGEIRKVLIERGEFKQPKEIEAQAKRIFKSRQIAEAVTRIEQAGGKAEYKRADATDGAAFGALFDEIKREYGKIDGLIHAAGVLEDKRFRDKELDSFRRVYDTKVAPLSTVVQKLLPDLKLLVLFSSVSSSFGNAGQCDYAAGNSVLDSTARVLKQQVPALRVVSFNWGPWKGAGMVGDALEREFQKRGVSLIELESGGKFFVDELIYGDEPSVLAMAVEKSAVTDLIDRHFGN